MAKDGTWVCEKCGSREVLVTAWVNPNTGKMTSDLNDGPLDPAQSGGMSCTNCGSDCGMEFRPFTHDIPPRSLTEMVFYTALGRHESFRDDPEATASVAFDAWLEENASEELGYQDYDQAQEWARCIAGFANSVMPPEGDL